MRDGTRAPRDWQPNNCPNCGKRMVVAYQPASDTQFIHCVDQRKCRHMGNIPQEVLDMPVDGNGFMAAAPAYGKSMYAIPPYAREAQS